MCRQKGKAVSFSFRNHIGIAIVAATLTTCLAVCQESPNEIPRTLPLEIPAVNENPPSYFETLSQDEPPATNNGPRGGLGGFGGPGMGGGSGGPGYSATWYPSQRVSGQTTELGIFRQSINLGAPIWRNGGDMLLFNVGIRNSLFSTDAILPDSGRQFPDQLWNINFSFTLLRQFENGWSGGLMTGFGSASDQPFHSIREMNLNLLGFLRIPVRNERDSWMFSVMYAPTGNLNFPIPGVAYSWNPSDDLRVNIGLPFSVMWRPVDELTIDMSYIPLTNINARATYRIVETVFAYGGYEFLNESFFLADREDSRARFMGFEQRLIAGVRWDFWRRATLDFNAGYAFDRYYGEGRNQGSDLQDRVNIAPGAFLGSSLRMRF